MENENNIVTQTKPKKKWLKRLIIFVIIVGIIIVVLGYLFPGLIWAKSLNVKYTKEDYASIMEKLDYIKDDVPIGVNIEEYEYKYGKLKNVNIEFTSEELTAFFNEERPSYFPVKNVQILINENGTIEAVATANVDYFLNNVMTGKYSRKEISKEMPALGILPNNVNLYLKVEGSITNNKSTLGIDSVAVQGIPLGDNITKSNEAINTVTEAIDKLMSDFNAKTGSDFYKIYVENGRIKFQAKVISSLERIKK
jgi:hypothetical protein